MGLAGPAAAGMADACKLHDTELAPYVAALEAEGWQRLPPGPKTDDALLQSAAADFYTAFMRVPDTPEAVESSKVRMRTRIPTTFTDAVAFVRDGLTASVHIVPRGDELTVRCIFTGSPLPETFARTTLAGPNPSAPAFSFVSEGDVLEGARMSRIDWISVLTLPDNSGLPRDMILYDAVLPAAK
jgi:hypothetical protein